MTQDIVNLTNHLITANRFDTLPLNDAFIARVTDDLEFGDVAKWSYAKLGEVLGKLDVGDVMASKKELLGSLNFSGIPGDTLREFASLCLAHTIKDRLQPIPISPTTIPYKSRRSNAVPQPLGSESAQDADLLNRIRDLLVEARKFANGLDKEEGALLSMAAAVSTHCLMMSRRLLDQTSDCKRRREYFGQIAQITNHGATKAAIMVKKAKGDPDHALKALEAFDAFAEGHNLRLDHWHRKLLGKE